MRTLDDAYISPVLTAHPTEVQRKSILDAERAIAERIQQRDHLRVDSATSTMDQRGGCGTAQYRLN